MTSVKGIINEILYHDPAIGWSVLRIKCSQLITVNGISGHDLIITGTFPVPMKYMPVYAYGFWKQDKYGWVLCCEEISETYLSLESLTAYLEYACEKELGERISIDKLDIIARAAGGNLFQVIYQNNLVYKLTTKTRLSHDLVSKVLHCVRKHKEAIDCYNAIRNYGGTVEHVRNMISEYTEPYRVLTESPYSMVDHCIPFEIADLLSIQQGYSQVSVDRITALVKQAVSQLSSKGHVCNSFEDLLCTVNKLTPNTPVTPDALFRFLEHDNNYIKEDGYYYESSLYEAELNVVMQIKRLQNSSVSIAWHPEYIERIEKELHVSYGEQQKESFKMMTSTGIKALSGGPGTGKTTTLKGLLRYLQLCATDVSCIDLTKMCLSAPSGRAAQRMSEATDRNALTCHKLLNYIITDDGNEYYRDLSDPIPGYVIIIDESSMVDLRLLSMILGAVQNGSLILFVGDVHQLPSVGPGAVLYDLLSSGCFDTCTLTQVFRQKGSSSIPFNSSIINEGRWDFEPADDFIVYTVPKGTGSSLAKTLTLNLIEQGFDPNEIQALSPVKNGSGSVEEINRLLQPVINPHKPNDIHTSIKGLHIFTDDRIMLNKNNHERNYCNGDVGYITHFFQNGIGIQFDGKKVTVPADRYWDISLAYCMTFHKSQGSEYPYVLIVLPESAGMNRELLYTAVTRAKKKVCIISEGRALQNACMNSMLGMRRSRLSQRLKSELLKDIIL